MAYASRSGRASASSKNPRAFAVCQRCGIWYNRDQLSFQFQWRGAQLQNIFILVCKQCTDIPQSQLRSINLPADPVPIYYPSVEDFENANSDFRTLAETSIDPITGLPVPSKVLRVTEDCENRVTEPYGAPNGLDQAGVMPWNDAVMKAFATELNVLSVTSNGTATIQVTCRRPHNLQSNSQIGVQGLAARDANGFFSVVVTTATAFTYATYGSIAANALITPSTRIITALVGLPRGFVTIQQIYGPDLTPLGETDFTFELENATGSILLENGVDFLGLQDGP